MPNKAGKHMLRMSSTASSCSSASSNREQKVMRIVVLGASAVGKTSLLKRFLFHEFCYKHEPTIEQLYRADFEVGSDIFTVDILDTSGSYDFPAMRNLAIHSGDAFVLVYSIDNEQSFKDVERLRDEIVDCRVTAPIVVVGNKRDREEKRQVQTREAESLVTIDWEHGFLETSAKSDENVIEIFSELLRRSDQHIGLSPAARRRRESYTNERRHSVLKQTGSRRFSVASPRHKSNSCMKKSCVIM